MSITSIIENTDYDVVIIGGGPAGCAAAIRLNQLTDYRVLVVERDGSKQQQVGESIPPDTRSLLELLGLWDTFQSQQHDPCLGSCSAWGSETLGYNDFIYNPMGHGWHLNRPLFNQMLQKKVQHSGVSYQDHTKFISSRSTDDGHWLYLVTNGEDRHVSTRWVIDATGIKSGFASKIGSQNIHQDHQVCLTGFFDQHNGPALNQLTLLESTTYGWWYAARLPDKRTVVALACDRPFLQRFQLRKEQNWLKLLMAHSYYIAPQVARQQWQKGSMSINRTPSCINSQIAGQNWLTTGDAASAYDPISAQGIYKALSQGIQAAEAIHKQHQGAVTALKQYSQKIKQQYAQYLEQRQYLYQQETRWQRFPFWQKRQGIERQKSA